MDRDENSMLANVFVDEVSNSSLIKKCFAKTLWLEDKHKELSVDGAAEIVTLPLTAYICAASDEIHTMKCSFLPTIASPTPVIILTFLIYRWLHPKDPPAEKNWWVTESTFWNGLRYTEAPLQSRILKENEPKLKKRACSRNEWWDFVEHRILGQNIHPV